MANRINALSLVSLLLQWQLDGELPAGTSPFIDNPLMQAYKTRCVRCVCVLCPC